MFLKVLSNFMQDSVDISHIRTYGQLPFSACVIIEHPIYKIFLSEDHKVYCSTQEKL